MTEAALPAATTPSLVVGDVLRDTLKLYRALFGRTVLTAGAVFAVVCLVETVAPWPVIVLSLVGTALVQGHGWPVFAVFVIVTVIAGAATFGIDLLLLHALGGWASLTIASALTTPFAAHALNVVYYRIVEPGRPLLPS